MTWSAPPAVVAGDTVTAALWNIYVRDNQLSAGVWQPWTPALTADGGGLSLGSTGTATGRYARLGSTVWWSAVFLAGGAGILVGSGWYQVSLPVAPRSGGGLVPVGHGALYGQAGYAPCVMAASLTLGIHGAQVSSTHGLATAGHYLALSGTYEAA